MQNTNAQMSLCAESIFACKPYIKCAKPLFIYYFLFAKLTKFNLYLNTFITLCDIFKIGKAPKLVPIKEIYLPLNNRGRGRTYKMSVFT